MKQPKFIVSLFIQWLGLLLSQHAFGQSFACFEVPSSYYNSSNFISPGASSITELDSINWGVFEPIDLHDGYYIEYYNSSLHYPKQVKCEGMVKDGQRIGLWKLFFYKEVSEHFNERNHWVVIGNYSNNLKQGLWKVLSIFDCGEDSVLLAEINFSNNNYNGLSTYYFQGEKQREQNYLDGKLEGTTILFSSDFTGNKEKEILTYSKNKLHGYRYIVNSSGDTLLRELYASGKKNGVCQYKNYSVTYKLDTLDGWFTIYHKDSSVFQKILFKDNFPFSAGVSYDNKGRILNSGSLLNGSGEYRRYYSDGKLRSSLEYRNGLPAGRFIHLTKDSGIIEQGEIYAVNDSIPLNPFQFRLSNNIDFNLLAIWRISFSPPTYITSYGENGCVLYHVQSILDSQVKVTTYEPNGLISTEETFLNGIRCAPTKEYREGRLYARGVYKLISENGHKKLVQDGWFDYYNNNKQVVAHVFYKDGVEHGKSFYFDNTGRLRRVKSIQPSGSVYNVFDGDTVNVTDEKSRKQGKWIRLGFSLEGCNDKITSIEYYQDNRILVSSSTWDIDSLTWIDSVLAYKKTYRIYDNKMKLYSEGYVLDSDLKNGMWKIYSIGKRSYLNYYGQYYLGNRTGTWVEYNKRGKIRNVKTYIE